MASFIGGVYTPGYTNPADPFVSITQVGRQEEPAPLGYRPTYPTNVAAVTPELQAAGAQLVPELVLLPARIDELGGIKVNISYGATAGPAAVGPGLGFPFGPVVTGPGVGEMEGGHIDWEQLTPEQRPDEETFFHQLPPVEPTVALDVHTAAGYMSPLLHRTEHMARDEAAGPSVKEVEPSVGEVDPGGWTPPEVFGWQPPTLGGGLDLTPGERGGLPWTDDQGFDYTPGARSGLPWTDDKGAIDIKPGPGVWKLPDLSIGDVTKPFDDMMMLILLMSMSER